MNDTGARSVRAAIWGPRALFVSILLSAHPVHAQAPPSPLSLAWCLERAQAVNPDLAAQQAGSEAAGERVRTAGTLEDPRFTYEASNVPAEDRNFHSTPLSGHQLGLRQKLPFPGLLSNREEAARAGARAAEHTLDDEKIRVAGAVEVAWAELGFAQRALEITERNIELLRQLARVAEARYRVGAGLQPDVLRAQVELTALLQEELRRRARVDEAAARLASLLDLSPDVSLPRTEDLEAGEPLPRAAGLLDTLEEKSPRLRAAAARVEAVRKSVRVAELEGYPDFDLGVGYRVRERVDGDLVKGDDFLSAGVRIRLPINRTKWRARVAEQRALLRREEARYRADRAELRARIRAAFADLERASAETELLDTGLVPQARQSLEASRSAYRVGRIDFLALLDSQVRLLTAELRRARAVADRRQAFAALEVAAGERLR